MNRNKSFFKKAQQSIIILFVLVILVLTFTILNPNYIKAYNLLSIVQSFVPYAIMAIGATFVIATGGIDLSVGTVCIASAVFAGKPFFEVTLHYGALLPLEFRIDDLHVRTHKMSGTVASEKHAVQSEGVHRFSVPEKILGLYGRGDEHIVVEIYKML